MKSWGKSKEEWKRRWRENKKEGVKIKRNRGKGEKRENGREK